MNKIAFLTLLFTTIFYCPSISAQTLRASFINWNLFTTEYQDKKICYLVSLPVERRGNYYHRGEPYILITNIDNNSEEVSISSGYFYKKNSEVELSFGLEKIGLFTYDDLAWAYNSVEDIEIIKQMRKSQSVVVSGIKYDESYSQDTYSLIGFTKAYYKMKEVCYNKQEDNL